MANLLDTPPSSYTDALYELIDAKAACKGLSDPNVMFPVGDGKAAQVAIARAKTYCASCPVVDQCLEYALAIGEEHGVWGGTSETERRMILKRRRSAA